MGRGTGFRNVECYFREILTWQQFYVPGTGTTFPGRGTWHSSTFPVTRSRWLD
uniref:Uncharacterized protein n=1 Tax=Arundo donax TaxID=35708 RepID=A0A0A9E9A2_ARUDO